MSAMLVKHKPTDISMSKQTPNMDKAPESNVKDIVRLMALFHEGPARRSDSWEEGIEDPGEDVVGF